MRAAGVSINTGSRRLIGTGVFACTPAMRLRYETLSSACASRSIHPEIALQRRREVRRDGGFGGIRITQPASLENREVFLERAQY